VADPNVRLAGATGSVLVRAAVAEVNVNDAAPGLSVVSMEDDRDWTAVVSSPWKNNLLAIKSQSKSRRYQKTETWQKMQEQLVPFQMEQTQSSDLRQQVLQKQHL